LTGVILVKELSGSKSGGGHCGVNLFALRWKIIYWSCPKRIRSQRGRRCSYRPVRKGQQNRQQENPGKKARSPVVNLMTALLTRRDAIVLRRSEMMLYVSENIGGKCRSFDCLEMESSLWTADCNDRPPSFKWRPRVWLVRYKELCSTGSGTEGNYKQKVFAWIIAADWVSF
jgi:hypothetical protein